MPSNKNINSVKILSEKLSRAKSIYFTDYLGLDVSDVTKLRRRFFNSNVEYIVVKNTLLKIASAENKLDIENDIFSGSTAIALSYDEPVAAAKVIKEFLKEHDLPSVKGVLFDGSFFKASEFNKFADLPNKEESLTSLVIMLTSPIRSFASLINSPMTKFVNVLNRLKDNKS